MKIKFLLMGIILFINSQSFSQNKPASGFNYLKSSSKIQDKNFYFFTVLENQSPIHDNLKKNAILQKMFKKHLALYNTMPRDFNGGLIKHLAQFKWSESEIDSVYSALITTLKINNAAYIQLINHLKGSNYYILYKNDSNDKLIENIWHDAALAQNRIIDTYLLNQNVPYPRIDSATYNTKSKDYAILLFESNRFMVSKAEKRTLFFGPSLDFCLSLLFINDRDEAVRFEPLTATNFNAYKRIKTINWHKYKYTAILIPGEGPENNKTMHPIGKMRCMLAAEKFKNGIAPFIIISGGFVHPFQTPYCEAEQMKLFLIKELNIPENCIILEPHARHTTTNLRNANRIIFKQNIPTNQPVLIMSTIGQIEYIDSKSFENRCLKELNHVPFIKLKRLDEFSISYYPNVLSLHINTIEPLDP